MWYILTSQCPSGNIYNADFMNHDKDKTGELGGKVLTYVNEPLNCIHTRKRIAFCHICIRSSSFSIQELSFVQKHQNVPIKTSVPRKNILSILYWQRVRKRRLYKSFWLTRVFDLESPRFHEIHGVFKISMVHGPSAERMVRKHIRNGPSSSLIDVSRLEVSSRIPMMTKCVTGILSYW